MQFVWPFSSTRSLCLVSNSTRLDTCRTMSVRNLQLFSSLRKLDGVQVYTVLFLLLWAKRWVNTTYLPKIWWLINVNHHFLAKKRAFSLGVSPMKMAVFTITSSRRWTRFFRPGKHGLLVLRGRADTSQGPGAEPPISRLPWAPCCTSWDMPLGWHMNKRDPTGRLVLVVIGCDDYSNPKKEVGWSWSDPTKKVMNYLAIFFLGYWWLLCAWLITCYNDSWDFPSGTSTI